MTGLSRRRLFPALGAAAAGCAGGGRALVREGEALASRSVQLSGLTLDGRTGFALRVAHYPTRGVAWIWAHVFLPGRMWSLTHDAFAMPADQRSALLWQADGGPIRIERPEGPDAVLRLSADLRMHPGGGPHVGAGSAPVRLAAVFRPDTPNQGLLQGRTEAKGVLQGRIEAAGEAQAFEGFGAFHEQDQATARFVQPFVYFRGSGQDLGFTFIKSARPTGYFQRAGREASLTEFAISRPAAQRRYRARLSDGRVLEGELQATHTFVVPIFGKPRLSQLATGTIEGQPFVGQVNDWLAERIGYDNLPQTGVP